jgi:porin
MVKNGKAHPAHRTNTGGYRTHLAASLLTLAGLTGAGGFGGAAGVAWAEDPADGGALFSYDPLDRAAEAVGYRAAQVWLSEHLGLDLEVGYTLIYQAATDRQTPQADLATGSFDIAGEWRLLDDEQWGQGVLGFLAEGGQIIGHDRQEDLSANVGANLGINDDTDNTAIAVTELWWAHRLWDGQLTLTVGKIDQSVFMDTNRIANDGTAQFTASPLVNNPAIGFPDNGIGINAWWQVTEDFYVTAGFGDGGAVASHGPAGAFDDGHEFVAIETGLTVRPFDRQGTYRMMLWYTEAGAENGPGFAISADQEIADQLVAFCRFGVSDDDLAVAGLARYFASGGVGIEGPFGRADDLFAVGAAWAELPGSVSGGNETLLETFYRLQLTDTLTVSPHVQVILDPADSADRGTVGVFGCRMQFVY